MAAYVLTAVVAVAVLPHGVHAAAADGRTLVCVFDDNSTELSLFHSAAHVSRAVIFGGAKVVYAPGARTHPSKCSVLLCAGACSAAHEYRRTRSSHRAPIVRVERISRDGSECNRYDGLASLVLTADTATGSKRQQLACGVPAGPSSGFAYITSTDATAEPPHLRPLLLAAHEVAADALAPVARALGCELSRRWDGALGCARDGGHAPPAGLQGRPIERLAAFTAVNVSAPGASARLLSALEAASIPMIIGADPMYGAAQTCAARLAAKAAWARAALIADGPAGALPQLSALLAPQPVARAQLALQMARARGWYTRLMERAAAEAESAFASLGGEAVSAGWQSGKGVGIQRVCSVSAERFGLGTAARSMPAWITLTPASKCASGLADAWGGAVRPAALARRVAAPPASARASSQPPLVVLYGMGTTATRTGFSTMCRQGVPGQHYKMECNTRQLLGADDAVVGGEGALSDRPRVARVPTTLGLAEAAFEEQHECMRCAAPSWSEERARSPPPPGFCEGWSAARAANCSVGQWHARIRSRLAAAFDWRERGLLVVSDTPFPSLTPAELLALVPPERDVLLVNTLRPAGAWSLSRAWQHGEELCSRGQPYTPALSARAAEAMQPSALFKLGACLDGVAEGADVGTLFELAGPGMHTVAMSPEGDPEDMWDKTRWREHAPMGAPELKLEFAHRNAQVRALAAEARALARAQNRSLGYWELCAWDDEPPHSVRPKPTTREKRVLRQLRATARVESRKGIVTVGGTRSRGTKPGVHSSSDFESCSFRRSISMLAKQLRRLRDGLDHG